MRTAEIRARPDQGEPWAACCKPTGTNATPHPPSHLCPQGALAQTHTTGTRTDQHLTILDLEAHDASHVVIFLTDLFQSLSAGPGRG